MRLLESYLSNRQQLTVWNTLESDLKGIEYGVPQGSILGPLLFMVYMNDFPSNIRGADLCLYADDFLLLKSRLPFKTVL